MRLSSGFVLTAALAAALATGPGAGAAPAHPSSDPTPPGATYTARFDNVDVDQILNSKRRFDNYFNCLMDKGKCDPDAKELKRLLPDALRTDCEKCTPVQRDAANTVIEYTFSSRPAEWSQLSAKYDPEGVYWTGPQ
ncbi:Insect pheromone-binding family, A10/OS-D [Streptomyces sp. YIM 121038]|uniref:A10/OS-D family protein n=1 Tax=Streptomyces sp. YIM 121038 TaxID=2136401 RepID=UPI0011100986|nr:A10/OS-D family protein [Streptomyces sp. YIM 121038]QCX75495.1 Insect pheromone-binding family, A10/OS-D [Streptomyces sp. YIM 121038]